MVRQSYKRYVSGVQQNFVKIIGAKYSVEKLKAICCIGVRVNDQTLVAKAETCRLLLLVNISFCCLALPSLRGYPPVFFLINGLYLLLLSGVMSFKVGKRENSNASCFLANLLRAYGAWNIEIKTRSKFSIVLETKS